MRIRLPAFVRRSLAAHGKICSATIVALVLVLCPESRAEYLIYLKGGHYIVVDDCTFSSRQEMIQEGGAEKDSLLVQVEDCTKGKPEGPIFWSTLDGKFGELNPDDVYAIFGARTSAQKRRLPSQKPLEDYLITNRGESFVNAKIIEQKEDAIYGIKRDEPAKVDRRNLADIAPEGEARSRSGEGLCAGEPAEFSVTEIELVEGHLVGVVTNLSQTSWKPWFEVEVREKGRLQGKFRVPEERDPDVNVVAPGDNTAFDKPVPARFLKYVERVSDPGASVRVCYRKVKTGVGQASK